MTISSTLRGGLCGLTLALSFGVANAADLLVPSQYPTIQGAINAAANSGDRVLVADGVYFEHDIDLGIKNLEVRSVSDNPAACIVDAQRLGRVFTIVGGQTSATVLRGFTIRNGATPFPYSGGGVFNYATQAVITNCIFTGNSTGRAGHGGGAYSNGGTISNCMFTNNSASSDGGGAIIANGVLTNCTFRNNSAAAAGGGASSYLSKISNCTFTNNSANDGGGGIFDGSNSTITNCTFTGNSAVGSGQGGGAFSYTGKIINCTFISNSASRMGGLYGGVGTIANCIIYENTAASHPNVFNVTGTLSRNLIGDYPSTPDANGNFGADPLFVNPATGDLRLQPSSPAIDKGDDSAISGYTTDLDGNARIQRTQVDLGAYEHANLAPLVNAGADQGVAVAHDGDPATNTASVTLNGSAIDPEGDAISYVWNDGQGHTATGANPSFNLPAGSYTFALTATDSFGAIGSDTVVVVVSPEANAAPTVSDQGLSLGQDTSIGVTLDAADPDGDALTYTVGSPANGTVSGTAPNLTYTPAAGYVGSDSFTVIVKDSYGASATATIAIAVKDTTPPVITLNGSDPMSVIQGTTFTDPGATAIDNVDGSVPVSVSGSVNTATVGSYTLTYAATDAAGNRATRTRTVNVVAPVSSSKIVVSLKELESDDDCGRGRDGGEVEAEFVLRNTGTVAEDNVTITSVNLGGKSPKGKLPKRLGTIRAGRKEDAEFEFMGVRRGTYTLTLSGTSSKGSFSFTQTVTLR